MPKRSTKHDSYETPLSTEKSRKIAEFTADLKPIARALEPTTAGNFISDTVAESSIAKSPVGAALASLYTDLTGGLPTVESSSIAGFALEKDWAKDISDWLNTTVKAPLDTFSTILTQIKALLLALQALNLSLDDLLYALIKIILKKIDQILSLLDIDEGVYLLVVPPRFPKMSLMDTSVDEYIHGKYAILLAQMRTRLRTEFEATSQEYAIRDLDYMDKAADFSSTGPSQLKKTFISSLYDKYDPYRPMKTEDPTSNLIPDVGEDINSVSAGLIITAGGDLKAVKDIFDGWNSVFQWAQQFSHRSKDLYRPDIHNFEHVEESSGTYFNLSYGIDGAKFNFYSKYFYLPTRATVVAEHKANDQKTEHTIKDLKILLENSFDDIHEILTAVVYKDNAGVNRHYTYSKHKPSLFDREYLSASTIDFKLRNERLQMHLYLDPSVYNKKDTVKAHVVFEHKQYERTDGSYTEVENSEVLYTYSTASAVISTGKTKTPRRAASSKLPNWISYRFQIYYVSSVVDTLRKLGKQLAGLFEVNVQGPIQSAIETTIRTIEVLEDIIKQINTIIQILERLLNLTMGGYATVFGADGGVKGVEAAIEDHFEQLSTELTKTEESWNNKTTAGMILLAKSNAVESLLVLKRFMSLLFGDATPKKEDTTGEKVAAALPAASEAAIAAEVEIASAPLLLDRQMEPTQSCGSSPDIS